MLSSTLSRTRHRCSKLLLRLNVVCVTDVICLWDKVRSPLKSGFTRGRMRRLCARQLADEEFGSLNVQLARFLRIAE